MFWLPQFLSDAGMNKEAALIFSLYDVGTFLGGMFAGIITDRINGRAILLCPMLLISGFLMLCVYLTTPEAMTYYFLMFFIGLMLGGPYNTICTTISIDLAKQPELLGKPSIICTVASVINSVGSFFAAIFQLVIPYI
jgi:sugar phosphate permease